MTKLQSVTKTNEVKIEDLKEAEELALMLGKYGISVIVKEK